MRRIEFILFLLLGGPCFAQSDSGSVVILPLLETSYSFRHLGWERVGRDTTDLLLFEHNTGIESSTLNGLMINDYMFRSSFGNSGKERFLNSGPDRSRLVAGQQLRLTYHRWDRPHRRTLWQLTYDQRAFGVIDRQWSQALLFGNAAFEGTELTSGRTSVTNIQSIGAYYGVDQRIGAWEVRYRLGLEGIINYASFTARGLKWYTHTDGAYMDLTFDKARWRSTGSPLGLMINSSVEAARKLSSDRWVWLALDDINSIAMRMNQWNLDSSFRFQGVELQGKDLLEGDPENIADSLWSKESEQTKKTVWTSMPSTFRVGMNVPISAGQRAQAEFRSIAGFLYGWQLMASHFYEKSRWALRSDLGYGNYSGLIWSEKAEFKMNEWNVGLGILGVQTLVAPAYSSSLGWSLAFSRAL